MQTATTGALVVSAIFLIAPACAEREHAENRTQRPAAQAGSAQDDEMRPVHRPGAVVLEDEYDISGLSIPRNEIHALLPRDAIPALTDPDTDTAEQAAAWLRDDDRVILTVVNDKAYIAPFRVLDWHEVVNVTLGGEPIAVTYCPLCDSATVFSRRVQRNGPDGEPTEDVLEFGVSGSLYNSNVLMYDRTDMALWSQLGMEAVSGPLAGQRLEHLPVRVLQFAEAARLHPDAPVVNRNTGHARDYDRSPYTRYFESPDLMVPVRGYDDRLERKTLGVGVADDDNAWFVPVRSMRRERAIETAHGPVRLRATDAGVDVIDAPRGVRTAQTFYYAWSAFFPETEVVTD